MKKILPLVLLITASVNAQLVNIPDLNFKAKLLSADVTNMIATDINLNPIQVDVNQDGEIQQTEALTVIRLNVADAGITDLSGIGSFSNLRSLDCQNNQLTTLDLTTITGITQLNCGQNRLTSLNLSNMTGLLYLFCSDNQLTSLNLNGLSQLSHLDCSKNNLSSLNLSGLNGLNQLLCSYNQLVSLNLSNLNLLTYLQCDHNRLTALDLTNLTQLVQLFCFYNQITNLDLTNSPGLTRMSCGENNITTLNLNGLTQLTNLECSYLPNNVVINGANLNALTHLVYNGQNTAMTLNGFPVLRLLTLNLSAANFNFNVSGFNPFAYVYVNGNQMTSLNTSGTGTTNLQGIECSTPQLTSLNVSGITNISMLLSRNSKLTSLNMTGLSGLKTLDCRNNQITALNLTGMSNLEYLICSNNRLTTLNLAGLSNLIYLDCSNDAGIDIFGNELTALNLTGLTNLEYVNFSNYRFSNVVGGFANQISTINVSGLNNLQELHCSANKMLNLAVSGLTNLTVLDCSLNLLTGLNLSGLSQLTKLNYSYNQLSNLSLSGLNLLIELDCSGNSIVNLSLSNLTNLTKLSCMNNLLATLNLNGLNLITDLNCAGNQLTTLNLSALPNLASLSCNSNQLTALNLNVVPNLHYLQCSDNQIPSLDLSALTNLQSFYCNNNLFTSLDITNLAQLIFFNCSFNQLTTLDLTHAPNLSDLNCRSNQITNLDLSLVPELLGLECSDNLLTTIDVSPTPKLLYLSCSDNQLTTLDVSTLTRLGYLFCDGNLLTSLYMKNGSRENAIRLMNNPLLAYVCVDGSQVAEVQALLNTAGMTTTVCNSYCTFTPGGPHNSIIATTIFDGNNNGCNLNDPLHPNIRIDINDGTNTGTAFTNTNGIGTFYTDAGNYTITPNIENASAFNISPASAVINFTNNFDNVNTQSFCLSANGVHPDIEVVISPVSPARPGFDAAYKIIYKNKGNQLVSGNVTLAFDDGRLDLIAALPAADTQVLNSLNWAYNGLLPFESRTIELEFNVNSPQETPAVNIGDILGFTVSITPLIGDEIPSDNQYVFTQTVVGSFDPNDITCLEGDTVPPTEIGKYLHYVINFENTGNFAAENVVVRDSIDTTKYDISSLQVLSTSHNASTRITGNVVEFIFEGIQLAALSGNPPVGGHGDILFKIKTRDNLVVNDVVSKEANIYFDYNAPITTLPAETVFATLSNSGFNLDATIKIHPNPTASKINIDAASDIKAIQLYDVQGRLLQTVFGAQRVFDLSDQAGGLYFIKITTNQGSKVEKVVKK